MRDEDLYIYPFKDDSIRSYSQVLCKQMEESVFGFGESSLWLPWAVAKERPVEEKVYRKPMMGLAELVEESMDAGK